MNMRERLEATAAVDADNCRINGNVARKGTRIYHVPGNQSYARTQIATSKGEPWFCPESTAPAAGWR